MDGNNADELRVSTPFDVEEDWDYIFFKDPSKLKFSLPGTYTVSCDKPDGTTVASGEVVIIPGEEIIDYNDLGNAEYNKQNYNKAIEYYTKAIESKPDVAEYYLNRGDCYDLTGSYDNAIKDYLKCLSLDANNDVACGNLGWSYLHKSNFKEALKSFFIGDKISSDNLDIKLGTALSYYELKDFDNSKKNLEELIKIIPELKDGMKGINVLEDEYNSLYTVTDKKLIKEMLDYLGYK